MTTPHDLDVCCRDAIGAAAEAIGWDVSAILRDTERVRYAITVGTNAALQRQAQARPADRRAVVNSDAAQSGRRRLRGCGDGGAGGRRDRRRRSETSSNEARGHVSSLTDASRERAVRDLFEDTYAPGCIDGVPVDIGRDVVGDASLPRRTATVLFNAYVHPDVGDSCTAPEDHLRANGYRRPLLIVHNDRSCSRVAKTVAGKSYNSRPDRWAAQRPRDLKLVRRPLARVIRDGWHEPRRDGGGTRRHPDARAQSGGAPGGRPLSRPARCRPGGRSRRCLTTGSCGSDPMAPPALPMPEAYALMPGVRRRTGAGVAQRDHPPVAVARVLPRDASRPTCCRAFSDTGSHRRAQRPCRAGRVACQAI